MLTAKLIFGIQRQEEDAKRQKQEQEQQRVRMEIEAKVKHCKTCYASKVHVKGKIDIAHGA
jgi:hypothetical protein